MARKLAGFETVVRSRRSRVAVAATMAACGVWAFAPYVLNEVGGTAYVNAPVLHVSSPIAGITQPGLPPPGSYIAAPTRLRLVLARSVDDAALGALLGQRAALSAALALGNRQLGELAAADRQLAVRAARYGRAEGGRLSEWAVAARADTRACRAEAEAAGAHAARIAALATRGFAANATVERADAAVAGARARCEALAARAAASVDAVAAARDGMYLGSGTPDTPYAEQQRDRLLLRRQELETVVADARARLDDLGPRIDTERRRLAQAAAYDVTLPAEMIVWQVGSGPGSSVVPGSALVDLVDCSRRFVEVDLPERRMEALVPGTPVQVRLIGGKDWQTGRIVRIVGAAARRDSAMVAASDSNRDPRALTVEVALPPPPIAAASRRCDVGRLAEVRFSRWAG